MIDGANIVKSHRQIHDYHLVDSTGWKVTLVQKHLVSLRKTSYEPFRCWMLHTCPSPHYNRAISTRGWPRSLYRSKAALLSREHHKHNIGFRGFPVFIEIRKELVLPDDLFGCANGHGSWNVTPVLTSARLYRRECPPKIVSSLLRCFLRSSNCWSWFRVSCCRCDAYKLRWSGNGKFPGNKLLAFCYSFLRQVYKNSSNCMLFTSREVRIGKNCARGL